MKNFTPTTEQLAAIRDAQMERVLEEFKNHEQYQKLIGVQTATEAVADGLAILTHQTPDSIVNDIRSRRKIRRLTTPLSVFMPASVKQGN